MMQAAAAPGMFGPMSNGPMFDRPMSDQPMFGAPVSQRAKSQVSYRQKTHRAMTRTATAESGVAPVSFGGGSSLVAEARRWIGTNPTGRSSLWCARFMNFVLQRSGYKGTSSDLARSFASYGHRISGPQVGAIAVIGRRGGGHVGVVSGIDSRGNPIIISGNHSHRVGEGVYPRGRVYAYVMP